MDMIREESEPEVVPISPPSSTKPSSTVTKSSSKPHPFSFKLSKRINLLELQLEKPKEKRKLKRKLTLRMNTDLQLRKQESSLKRAPPDPKLGKANTSAYGKVTDVGR